MILVRQPIEREIFVPITDLTALTTSPTTSAQTSAGISWFEPQLVQGFYITVIAAAVLFTAYVVFRLIKRVSRGIKRNVR